MHLGQERTVPLHESGTAPRVFVHDIDRLEANGDGHYCAVFTSPLMVDGHREDTVILYVDCTWRVIGKGVVLAAMHVAELTCLHEILGHVKKAVSRLSLH